MKKCKHCGEEIILGFYEGKEMILSEGLTRNKDLKKIKKFFPHSCKTGGRRMIDYFTGKDYKDEGLEPVEKEVYNTFGNNSPKRFKKSKLFKPKVRESWRKDATIKLQTFLETTENPKNSFTNEEKVVNVHIKFPWGTSVSTSFNSNKKGKKELLKFIKEELHL